MGRSTGGIVQTIVGAALVAVGAILAPVSGGLSSVLSTAGYSLMATGAISVAMGVIFKQKALDDPRIDSPTYGISQFENRAKGDVSIPVVYSNDTASERPGHRLAPIYIQASVTPRGYEDADFNRTKAGKGQGVSCLFAVAEGPIESIDDVRVNDAPIWQPMSRKANGTGSKKVFEFSASRLELGTLQVSVAGVSKGWTRQMVTERLRIGGTAETQTIFVFVLPDYNAGQQFIDDAGDVLFYLGATATAATLLPADDTAELRPMCWQEGAPNRLVVWTQQPVPAGKTLWISVPVKKLDNCSAAWNRDEGKLKVTFTTAPANGAEVLVKCRARTIAGARVEYRMGGAHQLPIDGFDSVRNAVGVNAQLDYAQSGPFEERTTDEEVDDVVVDLGALRGLYVRDKDDGSVGPRTLDVQIGWRLYGETKIIMLRDPSSTSASTPIDVQSFRMAGNLTSGLHWAFSVKRLLEKWVEEHPKDANAAAELAKWPGRKRVVISVRRVTPTPSDDLVVDTLTWTSYEKVLHERLSYPGVALLGFHGIAGPKLQGSLPRVTVRVAGKRDVEVYSGGAWAASPTAQANPVWAAIDLITARRYGGGEQFTKSANIDTTSAALAAAWCDETVADGKGGTEKQAVLDIVLDSRDDLMAQVARILMPARVVPVLRGNVWAFVIDKAATLADVPTIYEDGTSGTMLRGSLGFAHQPQTSQITEVQLGYLDRDDDFERNEVWVATPDPVTERRIERASADGVTRASQATRYASWLHAKGSRQGVNAAWSMIPLGLRYQAGDVVQVASTRQGISMYVRIVRWTLESSENIVLSFEAAQYMPQVYGQNFAAQTVTGPNRSEPLSLKSATTSSQGGTVKVGQVAASIRRAA